MHLQYLLKNSACKWTSAVQPCVELSWAVNKGLAVFLF